MFEPGPGLRAALPTLVLLLVASSPARAQPTLYTLDAPTGFSGLGITGTIHPVSAQEIEGFDFSGTGVLADAVPGDHVCNDGVGFFGNCFNTMDDVFAYRVILDPESMPLGSVTPSFAPANASDLWSGFILDDDAGTHEPDGEVFSNFSRGVIFQDFSDANKQSAYLQPGEPSAVLLTGFTAGSVATGLAAGPFSVWIRQGPAFGSDNFSVPVNVVPEPAAGALSMGAGLAVALAARRSRSPAGGAAV